MAAPLGLAKGARHHGDRLGWQLENGPALEAVALQAAQHDLREHLLQPLGATTALEEWLGGGLGLGLGLGLG